MAPLIRKVQGYFSYHDVHYSMQAMQPGFLFLQGLRFKGVSTRGEFRVILEFVSVTRGVESTVIERRQQQLGRMADFLPPVTFSVFDL